MIDARELSVIKIGGNEADDPAYLSAFAKYLHLMDGPKVIVHGGGKAVSAMQESLGFPPRFVEGQRYTDAETLKVVEMTLCGSANKRLVRALLKSEHKALGISGMDAAILVCDVVPELGLVGQPFKVQTDALDALLNGGFLPVIAPLGLGTDGEALNVNADFAAAAIARAMKAREMVLLTNVAGIVVGGQVVSELAVDDVRDAIADGIIYGGMIPKVSAALQVAEQGVRVRICDLAGILNGGTTIHAISSCARTRAFNPREQGYTADLQA